MTKIEATDELVRPLMPDPKAARKEARRERRVKVSRGVFAAGLFLAGLILGYAAWTTYKDHELTGKLVQQGNAIIALQHTNNRLERQNTQLVREVHDEAYIITELPGFGAALQQGQAQINHYLNYLACAVTYGAANCGATPPLPGTSSSQGSTPRASVAPPAAPAAPPAAPPVPGHGHGKARRHSK